MTNTEYVPHNQYCSDCGCYTTAHGPFGELLCSECWEAQDQAIEAIHMNESNQANQANQATPFTLEVGKAYLMRNGQVTTVLERLSRTIVRSNQEYYYDITTVAPMYYIYNAETPHDFDIVGPAQST